VCCCCRTSTGAYLAGRAGRAAGSPLPVPALPHALLTLPGGCSLALAAASAVTLGLVSLAPLAVAALAAAGPSTSWSRSRAASAARLSGVVAGGAAAAYGRLRYSLLLARSGCGGRLTPALWLRMGRGINSAVVHSRTRVVGAAARAPLPLAGRLLWGLRGQLHSAATCRGCRMFDAGAAAAADQPAQPAEPPNRAQCLHHSQ